MSYIQEQEEMFDRFSQQKQETEILKLFRKIEDKGYLYGMALNIYEREEAERKAGKRKGNTRANLYIVKSTDK